MSAGSCRSVKGVPVRSLKRRRQAWQRNRREPSAVRPFRFVVAVDVQSGQPSASPHHSADEATRGQRALSSDRTLLAGEGDPRTVGPTPAGGGAAVPRGPRTLLGPVVDSDHHASDNFLDLLSLQRADLL